MTKKFKKRDDLSALGIPAGLFIGMGVGFLIDKLVAGMFIGLGAGFFVMLLVMLITKKKR